jgi:hypothetical protein
MLASRPMPKMVSEIGTRRQAATGGYDDASTPANGLRSWPRGRDPDNPGRWFCGDTVSRCHGAAPRVCDHAGPVAISRPDCGEDDPHLTAVQGAATWRGDPGHPFRSMPTGSGGLPEKTDLNGDRSPSSSVATSPTRSGQDAATLAVHPAVDLRTRRCPVPFEDRPVDEIRAER